MVEGGLVPPPAETVPLYVFEPIETVASATVAYAATASGAVVVGVSRTGLAVIELPSFDVADLSAGPA
jgi:hypothetical protein